MGKRMSKLCAPALRIDENQYPCDVLLNFYEDLGWDMEQSLDPRKVRTSKDVFNKLNVFINELCSDSAMAAFLLMNSGPGVDDDIPAGMVYLLDGWMESA